jgi:hypothetical protein
VYHFGDSSFYEQCCVDLCTPCFDFHHNDLTVDVSPLTQGDEKSRNESALNYIVIAANGGHAGAQTKLGECYALGKYGMEEGNWKEARKWYGGGVVVGGFVVGWGVVMVLCGDAVWYCGVLFGIVVCCLIRLCCVCTV